MVMVGLEKAETMDMYAMIVHKQVVLCGTFEDGGRCWGNPWYILWCSNWCVLWICYVALPYFIVKLHAMNASYDMVGDSVWPPIRVELFLLFHGQDLPIHLKYHFMWWEIKSREQKAFSKEYTKTLVIVCGCMWMGKGESFRGMDSMGSAAFLWTYFIRKW